VTSQPLASANNNSTTVVIRHFNGVGASGCSDNQLKSVLCSLWLAQTVFNSIRVDWEQKKVKKKTNPE